jgi:hypothetical protein
MTTTFKRWLMAMAGAALVACGGGGGSAGTSPFGGGTGGPSGVTPTSDIIVDLSKSNIANTGSDTAIITVTALDASRNTIVGAPVTVSADSDAIVTTPTSVTGADGKLQSTLTIGANRANRVINVTVTSGDVTKTTSVQVFGSKLTGTLVPAVIEPGKTGKVQYRLVDQAGNPMVDQDIRVVASGLTPAEATGKTGANGDFEFSYTAPSAPGNYEVSASAGGTTDSPTQSVQVQSASTIPAVSETITSASVSANPSVVGTNLAGSTSNRSEIRALFLGSNNQPIRNVRVKFDLAGDANSIGGTFTTGTETLYSDINGVVTTSYVPGTRSSPTNGVTVRACYYKTDALAAADPYNASGKVTTCATSSLVTLTVTSEPLGVSIGTNELIIVNELTYIKKFVVTVVDSAGVAKPDVNIAVSVDLPRYRKGYYVLAGDTWVKELSPPVDAVFTTTAPITLVSPAIPRRIGDQRSCTNADKNRNGVLEIGEDIDGVNGNGNGRLDPGKSDVSVSLLQAKTRADGTAELQLQYAKSFATWVDVKITVAASGVSGTEGRASYLVYPVPADAASLKNKDVTPAYAISPYGIGLSDTNADGIVDCRDSD